MGRCIHRGATERNIFTLPYDLADVEFKAMYITYAQEGKTIVEKKLEDVERDGVTVVVNLAQDETLAFSCARMPPRIQMRILTASGEALVSEQLRVPVEDVLKEGGI